MKDRRGMFFLGLKLQHKVILFRRYDAIKDIKPFLFVLQCIDALIRGSSKKGNGFL